jgi:hypothetical protein
MPRVKNQPINNPDNKIRVKAVTGADVASVVVAVVAVAAAAEKVDRKASKTVASP